ncbi:hypothetical protein EG347_14865 [Chryseobacterium sp. G0186]|uniref:hypothetical protein n=1 Tax=Chryseobacterium sp. G0186 TaxID=2487064 RepID=UPI000F4F21C0|nr:hypothetical protein [Chryseobacterium sp. G0186]AZA78696.1 hypothetical protein EG347_14865 [Chryseobacterium sp. G0186]
MDIETLTNHISNLGKSYFDKACNLVLNEVFGLNAINIDGSYDGGTDMITFRDGEREKVAYQITTQKTDIKNKAYKDAEKSIHNLGIEKFYFLTTYNLSEIDQRLIEANISKELKINAVCLSPKVISGLIINDGKLNKFLESVDYPLPRQHGNIVDIKEKALHSYSVFSSDTNRLKFSVYEDTILFSLFNRDLTEDELITYVLSFLNLDDEKHEFIKKRIGGLFGKALIKKDENNLISLTEQSYKDLNNRQSLYEIELNNLSSAQTDLLQDKYKIPWTSDDSKKISLWIANSYIYNQLENLKEINVSIVNNNFYNISENGTTKLKNYLLKDKKIENPLLDEIVTELLDMASTHPLINKIARASVYVSLDGNNPIASAKAIGASRWSDVNIIVEPSVALPYICSILYNGNTNRFFKSSIKSINQAKSLDSLLYMPYYYINECAGHLLTARKYIGFEEQAKELEFSNNAFISNYFHLKNKGIVMPDTIAEYLGTFSSAIKFERDDVKVWVRSIMTDIQSLLTSNGIEFIDVPHYTDNEIEDTDLFFRETLEEMGISKKFHLFRNDIYTLKSTNDRIVKEGQVWVILSNDKSLISFSKTDHFKGWITNPIKFIEISELSKPMSESKLLSLVHSVATFSEKTLSLGARIMDKLINLSSKDIQNWELKIEIDKFKKETIESLNIEDPEIYNIIDTKTVEFINKHGLNIKEGEENEEIGNDDINSNL